MCGPSDQQVRDAASQDMFTNLLMGNYSSRFGAQSQTLQTLNSIYTPIAQAGPSQQGFSAPMLAALNTQSEEGVGANYAKATRALDTQIGAQGGGNQYLPNGAQDQLKSQIATAAAAEQSQEQLAITKANYAQGNQNWKEATAGLQGLVNQYNPDAGSAIKSAEQGFGMDTQVQNMRNQEQMDIASGITGLATSFIGGGLGNLAKAGEATAGEQAGNFFSGGLKGLLGNG